MNEKEPLSRLRCFVRIACYAAFVFVFGLTFDNPQACGQWYKNLGKKTEAIPIVFQRTPTQQELLALLASRYQSIRQLNSSVTVTMAGMPKIRGDIQLELPNRMRLKAGVMGVSTLGIDMGSNENQFWIWSKASLPGNPPAFYFANHQEFKQSAVHQNIPLDPQWLIDAIGLVNPLPMDTYHGPVLGKDGHIELFTIHPTPSGSQIRRSIISASTGLILQQAIYNSAKERLAYSNSKNYKSYPLGQTGRTISLPHTVELFVSQPGGTEEKIVVDLGKFAIDSLYGAPEKMWSMPDAGDGVTKINLAQVASPLGPPPAQNVQNNGSGFTQPNFAPNPRPNTGFRQSGYNR